MRTNFIKHLLSLSALFLFLLLAAASSKKTLGCGAFDARPAFGRDKDTRNLVVLNNGSVVEGDRIVVQSGLLLRDGIKLDGTMYKIDEVKGYQSSGRYYRKENKFFAERLVDGKGKTSVYMHQYERTTHGKNVSGRMDTRTIVYCDYYVQKGEEGPLVQVKTLEEMSAQLDDCPKSTALLQLKTKELSRLVRDNPRYLNEVFEIYNNGCR